MKASINFYGKGVFDLCDKAQEEWHEATLDHVLGPRWSPTHYHLLNREIKQIVTLCGKDPFRCTAAEMDTLNPRIFCANKLKKTGALKILRWREVVSFVVALSLDVSLCFHL